MTKTDLITRIESAGPEDQSKLVWEAFRRLDREAPPARYSRFKALHDAEAYLDAALMLLPEGYDWTINRLNAGLTISAQCGSPEHSFASTPALALLAAILKAGGRDGSH